MAKKKNVHDVPRDERGVPKWRGRSCLYSMRNGCEPSPLWGRLFTIYTTEDGKPMLFTQSPMRIEDYYQVRVKGERKNIGNPIKRKERFRELISNDHWLGVIVNNHILDSFPLKVPIRVILKVRPEQMTTQIVLFLKAVGRYNTKLTEEQFTTSLFKDMRNKIDGKRAIRPKLAKAKTENSRIVRSLKYYNNKPHKTVGDIPLETIRQNPKKHDTRRRVKGTVSKEVALQRFLLLTKFMKLNHLSAEGFARKFGFNVQKARLWMYFRVDIPKYVVLMLLGLQENPDLLNDSMVYNLKVMQNEIERLTELQRQKDYHQQIEIVKELYKKGDILL